MSTHMLNAALAYSERGWSVFPLHTPANGGCSCGKSDCKSPGKHPRTGHGLSDATTDQRQIREWWTSNPDANIGILTGRESGLLVVDVDGQTGSENFAALCLANQTLPQTMTVKTGNGKHLYFKHPAVEVTNSAGRVAVGVDVKAGRGYVVAPGSIHASGTRYEIENPQQALAEVPEWLLIAMTNKDRKAKEGKVNEILGNPFTDAPIVGEGTRNDTLHRLGSSLRGQHGMEQLQIENILLEYNEGKCVPPLGESEVLQIVTSVCKYPAEVKKNKSGKRFEENPLFWFKFNLRDFFADQNLMLMTDYQTGWYIRLKALAWQNGGFLPADPRKLYRLARAKSQKKFERDCELVLQEYEAVDHNGVEMLKNPRMAAQYADILDAWMQKKEAGQASRTAWLSGHKGKGTGTEAIQ